MRTLGADVFGQLAFAQLILQYAVVVIEFGYPLSATRRVAALKDDRLALDTTFGAILGCQLLLAALVSLILGVTWFFAASWREPLGLVLLGGATLIGAAIQPAWLFLGLERLRLLAVVQLAAKLLLMGLILLTVEEPSDLPRAMFISGAIPLVSGLMLTGLSFGLGLVRWRRPSLKMMQRELRTSFEVFTPGAVNAIYSGLPAAALGLAAPQASLAYFLLADRLKSAALMVLHPISTALVARMSRLFGDTSADTRAMVRRLLLLHALVAGSISCVFFFWAELVVRWVGGPEFAGAAPTLRWMAFIPLVTAISSVAALHVLLPSGGANIVHRATWVVSALGLACLWPFVSRGGEIAAAQFVLASEVCLCTLLWWFARHRIGSRRSLPA